jgi:hypothetical protein
MMITPMMYRAEASESRFSSSASSSLPRTRHVPWTKMANLKSRNEDKVKSETMERAKAVLLSCPLDQILSSPPALKNHEDDDNCCKNRSLSSSTVSTADTATQSSSSSSDANKMNEPLQTPYPSSSTKTTTLSSSTKKKKKKKKLSWAPHCTVYSVPSLLDRPEVLRDDIWFSADEYLSIKICIKESVAELLQQEEGATALDMRGLEKFFPDYARQRKNQRASLYDAIMETQDLYWFQDMDYSRLLCEISQAHSRTCVDQAFARGQLDAAATVFS